MQMVSAGTDRLSLRNYGSSAVTLALVRPWYGEEALYCLWKRHRVINDTRCSIDLQNATSRKEEGLHYAMQAPWLAM